MTIAAGGLVAARFQMERCLGRGGMGEVWAAKNTQTGKRVALKLLHAEVSAHGHQARLVREAKAAGALDHPNVCEVLDVIEHDGLPVLVLPLLEGETLAERLAKKAPLPLLEACAIVARAAAGVAAAHAAGVVHRDLKPANIFLEQSGGVRVLDFGIAKLPASDAEKLTSTGALLGTPAYMSPEQALGEGDVDHKSDVWSLGIVLHECLTGRLLTEAENVGQILKKVLFEPIPPIIDQVPDAPAALLRLLGDMLQRKRKLRLADARDAARILADIAEIEVVIAAPSAVVLGESTLPEGGPPESATTVDARADRLSTRAIEVGAEKDPTASALPRNRISRALPALGLAALVSWLLLGMLPGTEQPAPSGATSARSTAEPPVPSVENPRLLDSTTALPVIVRVVESSAPSATSAVGGRGGRVVASAPTTTATPSTTTTTAGSASQKKALRDRR